MIRNDVTIKWEFSMSFTVKKNRAGCLNIRKSLILPCAVPVFCFLLALPVFGGTGNTIICDDLLSVCFPTKKEGWACGRWGTILHSADGGNSWSGQISGADVTLVSIFFADALNGWAVGVKGSILHTTDGGKTWHAQNSPVGFLLRDVYFVSTGIGWIVTERTHILHTEDGGATWKVQFSDKDFELKALHFSDEVSGWAVGEFGFIYHTADGGKTWKRQAGQYEINEEGELEGAVTLFDVIAVDSMNVWAVGMDGLVLRTTDGGLSWAQVETGMPRVPLFSILANSQGRLVIGGRGVCAYSMNRGITWEQARYNPSIEYSWIYGMAEQDGGKKIYSVGERGAIYVCDSPDNWRLVSHDLKK